MSKDAEKTSEVMQRCKAMSKQREVEVINNKINSLEKEKEKLIGKAKKQEKKQATEAKKQEKQVTLEKDNLLVNVAANVNVKDVCRNIERKLQRNLNKSNKDDFQLLYDHLYYFYQVKHVTTLPHVVKKDGNKVLLSEYVAMRTYSVINDATCHINFGN